MSLFALPPANLLNQYPQQSLDRFDPFVFAQHLAKEHRREVVIGEAAQVGFYLRAKVDAETVVPHCITNVRYALSHEMMLRATNRRAAVRLQRQTHDRRAAEVRWSTDVHPTPFVLIKRLLQPLIATADGF